MSKIQLILLILQSALAGLSSINPVSADAKIVAAFVSIIQNALAAYQAETGAPLDLSKIPLETPVP